MTSTENHEPSTAPDEPVEPTSIASEEAQDVTPMLEQEVLKYKDLALRAQADFDNFRKRSAREKEETLKYANARLVEALLPVVDNFDLGLMTARQTPEAGIVTAGFEMVKRQLDDFLKDQGVEAIEATGSPFDPNLHEALGNEASATVADGIVLRQLRRGYRLRERLIRPANVIVSSGPATA